MSKPIRFGSAISAIVVASMLAGCATSQVKTGFGGKAADVDVGVATRALAAFNSNDIPMAIDLGERAVAKDPQDAGFRALLGNAYFAGGRFASAESAYKDSLTIYSNQPQVVLKLALVEIALGKSAQAVSFLDAGRSVLDPADYGLALALAGHAGEAIPVLDAAARQPGADSRVRQNLALAHALAGEWTDARTIAAQDVPVDQLDARIQQWMQLAKPGKPADQVAALVGVKPAAIDQGQPIRLALRSAETRLAEAAQPVPVSAPQPVARPASAPAPQAVAQLVPAPAPKQVAQAAPPPAPAPKPLILKLFPAPVLPAVVALAPIAPPAVPSFTEAVAVAAPAPVVIPAVAPAPEHKAAPKPVLAEAASPAPVTLAMIAAAAPEAPAAFAMFMPKKAPTAAKAAKPRHVPAALARPHLRRGDSVMQLGAYRTPAQVSQAWAKLTQRYPALRAYLPLRARFDSPKGTFWRLSVQGFDSEREAVLRCRVLKNRGGNCFVRDFAGDMPVQIASR
jgi:Flp pilus assembly protein TadD